jgi:hypothetical protein
MRFDFEGQMISGNIQVVPFSFDRFKINKAVICIAVKGLSACPSPYESQLCPTR